MTELVANRRSLKAGRRHRGLIGQIMLWVVALAFVSPLLVMVGASLKSPEEIFSAPTAIFGESLKWGNYSEAMSYAPFGRYLFNSLVIGVIGTVVNLIVCVLAGYSFAKLDWKFRSGAFALFLATMMLPQEVTVVPSYVLMESFGWVDSWPALILPTAFSAFGAFMLRQYFMTVPKELEEAARVDGAGIFRTFWSVMLPLARPSIVVVGVFTFISYWNSFLWPLIIVNTVDKLGTVPLGLQQFFGQQGSQWHLVMAASVISMLPMVLLVVLAQKYLVKGIATSGFGGR